MLCRLYIRAPEIRFNANKLRGRERQTRVYHLRDEMMREKFESYIYMILQHDRISGRTSKRDVVGEEGSGQTVESDYKYCIGWRRAESRCNKVNCEAPIAPKRQHIGH
jgi:hypothetical protein